MKAAWGVFLDRDGTLVPDSGYMVRPEQLRFYARTADALRKLKNADAVLLVVSNQSAVGRGLMDDRGLERMDRRLRDLARTAGAPLDQTYYCPHHPEVTGPCDCRKPAPGMIAMGLREFDLDPGRSFLVGDTAADLQAGRQMGLTTILVLTGRGREARVRTEREGLADAVVRDIDGAAEWILKNR